MASDWIAEIESLENHPGMALNHRDSRRLLAEIRRLQQSMPICGHTEADESETRAEDGD